MIAARAEGVKPSIGFNFVALPVQVILRNDISPAGKLLMAVLMDSARGNRSGLSKLCNATLGARIGRSASEAGRHLAELETLGLVRREYGRSKRIRIGIAITWVPEVQATSESRSTTTAQPGSANPANRVQSGSATIQIPPSEPDFQTGPILSTLGGENPDPKPSPQEIAEAIRMMLGGRHAAMLFQAQPEPEPEGPEVPPSPTPIPPPVPTPNPFPTPPKGVCGTYTLSPPTKGVGGVDTPDVRAMSRRVGYSAVAAIAQTRAARKPVDQQLEELRRWSSRRGS